MFKRHTDKTKTLDVVITILRLRYLDNTDRQKKKIQEKTPGIKF